MSVNKDKKEKKANMVLLKIFVDKTAKGISAFFFSKIKNLVLMFELVVLCAPLCMTILYISVRTCIGVRNPDDDGGAVCKLYNGVLTIGSCRMDLWHEKV